MALYSFLNINANRNDFTSKEEERRHLFLSIFLPSIFIILMWLSLFAEYVFQISFAQYGILPRTTSGLLGILTSPFIHGDINHLFSNTIPFFILGFFMIHSYRKVVFKAFIFIWLLSGAMVWLIGRQNYHIGASNLVYGFAFYIFFSGVFRKDFQSIVLSLFVVLIYGSIFWGIFPIKQGISWEGHLMGALAGTFIAFIYRKVDLPPKTILDDDEEEEGESLKEMLDDLKITYEIVDKESNNKK